MDAPLPSVKLDDQLCFALYSASRAVTARYRPMLDGMGITYPQLLVLMALWEGDDQTVSALGGRLGLDSGTMSPLLKRLEAAGMVTRRRSAVDERQVHVRLTDAGRALAQPAGAVSAAVIDAMGLDLVQFTDLKDGLERISEQVGRSSRATAPSADR